MILNVKDYVAARKLELKPRLEGKRLLVLQVGDDAASNRYVRNKMRDAAELGVEAHLEKFGNYTHWLAVYLYVLENRAHYDGIILQLPALLGDIDGKPLEGDSALNVILNAIGTERDIDGFLEGSKYVPCTPLGILNFMDYCGLGRCEGKKIAVIGRGKLVGEPLVPLLLKDTDAEIMVFNSHTPLDDVKSADIIISGVGKPGLIKECALDKEVFIIDAGTSVVDGKLCGDVDPELLKLDNVKGTSVPGGVGLLTRLSLFENLSF